MLGLLERGWSAFVPVNKEKNTTDEHGSTRMLLLARIGRVEASLTRLVSFGFRLDRARLPALNRDGNHE